METDEEGQWRNKLWRKFRRSPLVVKIILFILLSPLVIVLLLLLEIYVVSKFLFHDIPLFCLLICGCKKPEREPTFEAPIYGNFSRAGSDDPVIVSNQPVEDAPLPEGVNVSPPDYADVSTKVRIFVVDESDGEQPPPTYLEAAEGGGQVGSSDSVGQERY